MASPAPTGSPQSPQIPPQPPGDRPRTGIFKQWQQWIISLIHPKSRSTIANPESADGYGSAKASSSPTGATNTSLKERQIHHVFTEPLARKELSLIKADQQYAQGHKLKAFWIRFKASLGIYETMDFTRFRALGEGMFATTDTVFTDTAGTLQVRKQTKPHFFRHTQLELEQERDLLARMDHPNIIKTTSPGSTWLSDTMHMEDGGAPLTTLIRGHKSNDGNLVHGVRQPWTQRTSTQADAETGYTHNYMLDKARTYGGPLPPELIQNSAAQMIDALSYLQDKQIAHRDIKPDNIVIHPQTGQIKLIDFGMAKELGPENTTTQVMGSPCYMAPEVATLMLAKLGDSKQPYGVEADTYSAGCVLFELITGIQYKTTSVHQPPSQEKQNEVYHFHLLNPEVADKRIYIQKHVEKALSGAEPEYKENVIDLLKQMLDPDPKTRITPHQAKNHPFFTAPKKK